jgi:hypothetical protein
MIFDLDFTTRTTIKEQQYPNNEAHAEVMKMMSRGDRLSVKFGTTKNQHPYAWVESKTVAGFKYELDAERAKNLIKYMVTGEVSDYAGDLMQSDTLEANEDYQWEVMKQFIENGQTLQYTPLFREYNDRISAMKSMFKGTVFFRIPRTTENLDYLREHQQNI